MIKQIVGVLLCLSLVLVPGFVGEMIPKAAGEEGYELYFLVEEYEDAAGGGALSTQWVDLTAEDTQALATGLVEKLLEGPTEEGLKSAIPSGTSLLSLETRGGRAIVDLSASYGSLSGIALTLADYAITLTLTQLPDIHAVEITVRGNQLVYRDQQVFTGRDVLLYTEEDVVGTVTVKLYFLDENGELTPQRQTLELYEGDTQVGAVVTALADGPGGKELQKVFPEGFRVRSAWQEEEVCYVNLSSALLAEAPEMDSGALEKALNAIGKSMCSLGSVSETRFLVDGEFAVTYGGVDISKPYN